MDSYRQIRDLIVEVGKRMYAKDYVASNDGNISVRLDENRVMITPTGVSKGFMKPEEMCIIDMDGNLLSDGSRPSSEYKMHLAVYQNRADVHACVHAHPRKATAFAVAGLEFDGTSLPETIFSLGHVALAAYATPSSYELPQRVVEKIGLSDALLLANHGALTVGPDLMDAYYKMETLEHLAAITLDARLLGGEKTLPQAECKKLFAIRKNVFHKPVPAWMDLPE